MNADEKIEENKSFGCDRHPAIDAGQGDEMPDVAKRKKRLTPDLELICDAHFCVSPRSQGGMPGKPGLSRVQRKKAFRGMSVPPKCFWSPSVLLSIEIFAGYAKYFRNAEGAENAEGESAFSHPSNLSALSAPSAFLSLSCGLPRY